MSAILTVIAFSVAMFVFAYMSFKVDADKNKINMALQIFFMFISLIMFVGLAGTVSVNNNDCSYLLNQSVTDMQRNVTTNSYAYTCSPVVDYTPNTLLTIAIAIMIIFVFYVMIGIFYYVVDKLKESGKI